MDANATTAPADDDRRCPQTTGGERSGIHSRGASGGSGGRDASAPQLNIDANATTAPADDGRVGARPRSSSGRGCRSQEGSGMAARKRAAAKTTRKPAARRTKPSRPAKKAAGRSATPRERRHAPETLRLRSVTPGFTVADLRKSIAFYTEILGFVVSERWTDG